MDIVAGNMLWNAVLIGALGFMIRMWMKDMKDKVQSYCKENRDEHEKFFSKLETHGERIVKLETLVEDK